MKLSICVITMNRAEQLREALLSCLACELPMETEFVIIDNASTDHTEQVVRETLGECGYPYCYEKLSENIGAGGGRNYAYQKASGEYSYGLDDDSVVDYEADVRFFVKAIDLLDRYQNIVTLAPQIYDMAWGKNRLEIRGPFIADGLYKCFMFCGGAHFLRRSFYTESPYFPSKYGYEELLPSLRAMNAGKFNAFCPSLRAIHKPAVNKWSYDNEKSRQLLINEISFPYAIKSMMYPKVILPLLLLARKQRTIKYLKNVKNANDKVKQAAKSFCKEYPIKEKISLGTVYRMFKDFRMSIF